MPSILTANSTKINTSPEKNPQQVFFEALGMNPYRPVSVVLGTNQLYYGSLDRLQRSPKTNNHQPYGKETNAVYLDRQEEGGVFFRPNDIGHTNATWRGSQCLFWEIDDQDFETQQRRAEWLASLGVAYKAKVYSGGKSFHYYIAIDYTEDADLWFEAMAMIAVLMESDPSIPMLNRLMRLPGFHRLKGGEWREQELLETTDAPIYKVEDVIAILSETGRFPHGMDKRRFQEWRRACTRQQRDKLGYTIDPDAATPDEILNRDFEKWDAEKAQERQRKELERQRRREQVGADSVDPKDLIDQANDRLGKDAFLPHLDYRENGGKIRCLPLFRTGGGSRSAHLWLSPSGTWLYVDKGAGHSCDGFTFYVWRQKGEGYKARGAEFWNLLREYCSIAGIDVPEFTPRSFSDLTAPAAQSGPFGFLSTAIDRVLNRSERRQNRIERQASTVPVSEPDLIFQPGERLSAYQEAQRQGYKYVLDSSITGSGKSHSSGLMRPDDFGARQLIYCSDEHRNPTTPTLQEWPDLEARHPGLVREPQRDGTDRLRRAKDGDALSVMPNCSRIPLIETLRDKGVSSIDTAGTVCSGCPVREKCATAVGDGYGYIHQRAILKRPYLRCHPDSLPLDYDLESVAVIWDEIGKSFTANTTTTITNEDFAVVIEFLSSRGYDSMAAQLRIIRDTIAAIKSERDIHGAGFDKFTEGFGDYDFGGLNPLEIDRALDPNLDFLNPTADHGVDIKDLPPMLRRQLAGSGLSDAEAIPPQFYGDLLRVLTGQLPGGTCRIDKQGRLQLSVPRPQHRRIAKDAQILIAQDATLSKLELALRLGVQPSEIFEVREAHDPMDNLTIHQVTDLGFCGQYRGDDIQRRIDALVAQINQDGSPIIDFKKQKKDGAWFVDTRGVNIFQHEKQIILIGTPTANMAAVHAEWVALLGHYASMDSPEFHQYLAAKTQAEMAQAFGRMRANRRPDEEISIWLLSSFSLKPLQGILGFNLVEYTAEEITIEAASRSARSRYRILQFTQQLIESGKYPKIKIVAELANLTEGRVSQIAKKFFGGWKKLIRAVKLLLFGEDLTDILDPEREQEVNTIAAMIDASVHDTAQESAQLLSELLDGFGLLPEAIERLSDQSRAYLAARLLILAT